MATALDAAAERIAPAKARTNYFDPAPGQSVISRYANAGREVADSALAAEAADNLWRTRGSIEDRRRQRVTLSREDEEYNDRKAFQLERGGFLESIAAIDPSADDFEDQISTLYSSLPEAALKDDAVTDMLAFKRKRADDLLNERQFSARADEAARLRQEAQDRKTRAQAMLKGLAPEELPRDPVSGEVDLDQALYLAGQRARENKKTDQIEVAKEKQRIKLEADDKTLSPSDRQLKATIRQHILGDEEAFPNQVEGVRRRLKAGKDKTISDKDLKADPAYADAKLYESRKFEAELESARNMTLPQYLAKGGQSDTAKQKRTAVWEAAQLGQDQGGEPAGTKAAETKQLAADQLVVGKRYRDANGNVKTYRGDGQWE